MLQNAYLVAKIGDDTAENEQHFAKILPIGRLVAAPSGSLDGPEPVDECSGEPGSAST